MGFCTGLFKYLLFIFNLVIVICGIVLIAIGAIICVNENKGVDRFTSFSVGGFAIGVGVIIFLVAFFGCCGAIKENSCMLTTYAVVLILLFILQVVLGSLAFVSVNKDDDVLDKDVKKAVDSLFKNYMKNKDDRKLIDDLQKDLKCCGVDGPQYWVNKNIPIPKSCCKSGDDTSCTIITARKKTCTKAFKELVTDSIRIIAWVAVGFAVVELVGAIVACVVRHRK